MSMINNALSGLNAANVALTVAGQNVANAAVEGYSRQAAYFETAGSALRWCKCSFCRSYC